MRVDMNDGCTSTTTLMDGSGRKQKRESTLDNTRSGVEAFLNRRGKWKKVAKIKKPVYDIGVWVSRSQKKVVKQ